MKRIFALGITVFLSLILSVTAFAEATEALSEQTSAIPDMELNHPLELIDVQQEKITAYKLIPDYDVNMDGKISVVDVKAVLKHIADVNTLENEAAKRADADSNGKITVADAKLILQYIAGIRESYALEDGTLLNGIYKNASGGVYYFDEQGVMAKGLTELDGERYLFSYDGVMFTQGLHSFGGKNYLVLEDSTVAFDGIFEYNAKKYLVLTDYTVAGNGLFNYNGNKYLVLADSTVACNGLFDYNGNKYLVLADSTVARDGFFEYNGKKYLADKNGCLAKGRKTYNGKTYLFDENCALVINSSAKDNGVLYYTDAQGVLLNGKVNRPDGTYMYENGRPYNGWKYPGLDMFYYDQNGKLVVNTTIGDFTFDSNGNPSATAINHNTLRYHLRKILKQNGSDARSIFDYVTNHSIFSYKVMDKGASAEEMVIYMLKYHKGACYQFAYFTQALYKEAGFECEVVIGTVISNVSNTRSTHYWNKVKFSDGWYYIDTEYPWASGGVYKKTADEMKALTYRW